LGVELLTQFELQGFPSLIILDLILLHIEETKMFVPPKGVASIGAMYITPGVEPKAIVGCLRPFSMGHSKFSQTQSTEKLLAVYNGKTLFLPRLGIGFEGRQVGAIDGNIVESVVQEERQRHHPAIRCLIKQLSELEFRRDVHSARLQIVSIHTAALRDTQISAVVGIALVKVSSVREIVLEEPISDVGRHDIPKKVGEGRALKFLEVFVVEGE
jgi:hypothetical protein